MTDVRGLLEIIERGIPYKMQMANLEKILNFLRSSPVLILVWKICFEYHYT